MLLLALSFLYDFNYTIWDIVILGIFIKWPKSEVKKTFYLLIVCVFFILDKKRDEKCLSHPSPPPVTSVPYYPRSSRCELFFISYIMSKLVDSIVLTPLSAYIYKKYSWSSCSACFYQDYTFLHHAQFFLASLVKVRYWDDC